MTAPTVTLTDRQAEVLILLAQGHDMGAIARRMQISVDTARSHLRACLTHLGAANGTHAVALAIGLGLIPHDCALAPIPQGGSHVR